jgi:KaiC/GvpD/RAD55 family RecA-like ATPase
MTTLADKVEVKITEATDFDATLLFGPLIGKSANKWLEEASQRAVPRKLFKELWYEGELTILFATSGAGKSIFGVQIGNEIAENDKVLYLDCELSDKQFQLRYTNEDGKLFDFHPDFIRMELNTDTERPNGMTDEDFLIAGIEQAVFSTGAKVLIIDNITYLRSDTEKSKDALPLMKRLKALKKKHDLSLLVLAHTPKRDMTKPVTENDLFGSVMQKNFADAMFAIGVSTTDATLRYVKQIKERSTEKIYGEDNVIVYEISKVDCFLGFTFLHCGTEADYLQELSEPTKKELAEEIIRLHDLGKSLREIAKEMNVSHSKVRRIVLKGSETVKQ